MYCALYLIFKSDEFKCLPLSSVYTEPLNIPQLEEVSNVNCRHCNIKQEEKIKSYESEYNKSTCHMASNDSQCFKREVTQKRTTVGNELNDKKADLPVSVIMRANHKLSSKPFRRLQRKFQL